MAERDEDRLDQMHRFLDEHATEIRGWTVGKLTFDWVPGDLKFHIGRSGKVKTGKIASVDRAARLSA